MENPTTIAIDLSKGVFEVGVERGGRTCQRRRLNRRQLGAFLSECVGAQWWVVVPSGGHRPVDSSSLARRAQTRRLTPAPFADLRDGPSRRSKRAHEGFSSGQDARLRAGFRRKPRP